MTRPVDFTNVSTSGLESSPVADALAGLRANEARYFKNKYDHDFTVEPASKAKKTIAPCVRVVVHRAAGVESVDGGGPRGRLAVDRADVQRSIQVEDGAADDGPGGAERNEPLGGNGSISKFFIQVGT